MWDLPRSGIEPGSPALASRLFTTEPPGKPYLYFLSSSFNECALFLFEINFFFKKVFEKSPRSYLWSWLNGLIQEVCCPQHSLRNKLWENVNRWKWKQVEKWGMFGRSLLLVTSVPWEFHSHTYNLHMSFESQVKDSESLSACRTFLVTFT